MSMTEYVLNVNDLELQEKKPRKIYLILNIVFIYK